MCAGLRFHVDFVHQQLYMRRIDCLYISMGHWSTSRHRRDAGGAPPGHHRGKHRGKAARGASAGAQILDRSAPWGARIQLRAHGMWHTTRTRTWSTASWLGSCREDYFANCFYRSRTWYYALSWCLFLHELSYTGLITRSCIPFALFCS